MGGRSQAGGAIRLAAGTRTAVPKRTRTLLAIRKWLFGFALFFAALSVSFGELQESHFLFREYPLFSGGFLAASLLLWSLYFFVRRRIRTTGL